MEQTVVDVNDLSRSFGSKVALEDVSFHAAVGQVHGLVGANGAGKTTLLKHLLGLLRAFHDAVGCAGADDQTRRARNEITSLHDPFLPVLRVLFANGLPPRRIATRG